VPEAKVKITVTFVRDRQKPLAFFNEISKKALILPGGCTQFLHFLTPNCSQVALDMPPPG
jgi:hypothetical protein